MTSTQRERLRLRLLEMPLGSGVYLAAHYVIRPREGTWSVWARGQCRCERAAHEALDLAAVLALLAPADHDLEATRHV